MIDVPIQVKDALRDGRLRKNYRFVVLNEDGTESEIGTIDNNNLVSESVSIDERMCSGDTLKFGLCEGSSIEFQYFGKPNITGKRVQAFVDVDYGEAEPYTIPMGFFDVKKCSRQASTGIIKVTAYNKLISNYLDADASMLLKSDLFNPDITYSIYDIKKMLLEGYKIEEYEIFENKAAEMVEFSYITAGSHSYTSIYNALSPLNGYNAGYSSGTFMIENQLYEPNVQPYLANCECVRVNFPFDDMDAIEQDLYDNFHNAVTAAKISNSSTYWNNWVNNATVYNFPHTTTVGWQNIFGLYIEKLDGSVEFYSKVAKDNNLPNTKGTLNDINGVMIDHVKKIYMIIPATLWNNTNRSKKLLNFYKDEIYDYRESSSDPNIYYDWWYAIKLPNGQTLQEFNKRNLILADFIYGVSAMDQIRVTPADLGDVTLRELASATYESVCQFGQLSRITDLFSGVELNHSSLYPADTLYPANSLYPDGAQESSFRSQYSKLWADEGNVHKWRNLIITYKGLDENQQEKDFTLQRQVNADGTDDYNCSDNWLFRNLVWTSEQIAQYAEAMVAKMQPITWFPFEMWGAGLPYLETGDQIEIPLGEETYTSYILQRNLKGIQNLQDTYINGTLDIF